MTVRKKREAVSEPQEQEKAKPTAHQWQFVSRFRRQAFGWRSSTPIQRIKEAVSEIKMVARKDPALAAEGAVRFLERISPALEQVDSSSGALGTAVNHAIETLVPIIAKPDVDLKTRQGWLKRLWTAIEDDDMPYIEVLDGFWGDLCVNPELASKWADEFLPLARHVWSPKSPPHSFYKGTTPCLSSLYAASRHEELLALLEQAPFKWWENRRWGVRALVALGKKPEALRYAEDSRGLNAPMTSISRTCEEILLSSGMVDQAYSYSFEANQCTTHLATFRAIAKKYPNKSAAEILTDLAASEPGTEGKWFAAAKDAGLFDLAIDFVTRSPTDPRTLVRAARDFVVERPDFAMASGLAALHWISLGHGYEITGMDVLGAHSVVMKASQNMGMDEHQVKVQISSQISPTDYFVRKILGKLLSA